MKKLTISISILLLSNIAVADDISYRKNNLLTVTAPADQQVPDEQTTETADEKELNDKKGLFGGRYGAYHTDIGTGKYGALHASLALTGEWTDNLYNDKDDKIENLLTTLSAGAWYTFPKRSRKPIHIATNNTSTGGLQFSQGDNKFYNKHDFYIGGNLNYRMYSENSDLDMVTGTLTGMWSYTPSPKLSFQISDQYSINQDQFDRSNETSENQRVYGSNVLS
ncbi:MAG: hypothetical protein KAI39_11815, partial [Desulfobulbaceae bacterium]|nr:hypothetical protein [Desulfobulbaceae bacterium]